MSRQQELTQRIKAGLSARLAERLAVAKYAPRDTLAAAGSKMRIELLNLNRPDDLARWQTLHNDTDRYRIINEKESHQKGEYFVRIIYNELGDDLPTVKTQEQLRE